MSNGKKYYINDIKFISCEPTSCIVCGRNDDLVCDVVMLEIQCNNKNDFTKNHNVLCRACETLMVITNNNGKKLVKINASPGNIITIRRNNNSLQEFVKY